MNKQLARLIEVRGDQEEFADLIGAEGTLEEVEGLTFQPKRRGDWLSMVVRSKSLRVGKLTVKTKLGNTFVFQLM